MRQVTRSKKRDGHPVVLTYGITQFAEQVYCHGREDRRMSRKDINALTKRLFGKRESQSLDKHFNPDK